MWGILRPRWHFKLSVTFLWWFPGSVCFSLLTYQPPFCMFLDCGRKPENPISPKKNMQTLHRNNVTQGLNPGPSCCEETVLTTNTTSFGVKVFKNPCLKKRKDELTDKCLLHSTSDTTWILILVGYNQNISPFQLFGKGLMFLLLSESGFSILV